MTTYETFGGSNPSNSFLKTIGIGILFHLIYLLIPAFIIITPFIMLLSGNIYIVSVSVVFIIFYISTFDGSHRTYGKPWDEIINLPIVKWILEWFPVQIRRTEQLAADKQYVFACHPHGTLAFNRSAIGFSTSSLWHAAFPGIKFRVLTASAAFFVPFIRELFLWSYCVDASKSTAVKVMKHDNHSIFVYPGGEREQLETIYDKQIVYLNSRKGFVKLAIEHGANLVPVYAFGETNLYNHYQFGIEFRKWLVKKFGVAIPLINGMWGLLPHRVPLTLVFGKPIACAKIENPTSEDVDKMHVLYVNALIQLFNEHKVSLGYAHHTLHIL